MIIFSISLPGHLVSQILQVVLGFQASPNNTKAST